MLLEYNIFSIKYIKHIWPTATKIRTY
jgi:hypothetical protein